MKKLHLIFVCCIAALAHLIYGCSSGNEEKEALIHLESTQYLLTNKISMKNRPVVTGASSFLIELENTVYLCTAKHLTQPEMGFDPGLDLATYKDSVNAWIAYPRRAVHSAETIETTDLLYNEHVADVKREDVILLKLKQQPKEIGVLQPNFDQLEKGERLRIIGCEYSNPECHQKEFYGVFQQYTTTDELVIFMDSTNIELAGMSGAPVVNDQLQVVGVVSGGLFDQQGILNVYVSPVDFLKRIRI